MIFGNARFFLLTLLLTRLTPCLAWQPDSGGLSSDRQYRNNSSLENGDFSPIGLWRGVFELSDGTEIPFLFFIQNDKSGSTAYFINGDEKFRAGVARWDNDSLWIAIDAFDNELVFQLNGKELTGLFRRQIGKDIIAPVRAGRTNGSRFVADSLHHPVDISGAYEIVFGSGAKAENAVGIFHQQGKELTGTFLRITGDSRFLQGVMTEKGFYLSSFIGSQPSLYRGSILPDGRIFGEQLSLRSRVEFTGRLNEAAALPDAFSLTYLKEGYKSLDFSFPNLKGQQVSLHDEKFRGKVVIVTIGGTWCPNCIDDAAFLAPWYTENRHRGVEIISLQYEKSLDSAYLHKVIDRFTKRFAIQYEQLIAGVADKKEVAASLPALNTFLSFPTTIFIDRKGRVAKIHTGYTGPATGHYYQDFVREFNAIIDQLLVE